ncbi:hypothetical protein AGOR_G00098430 [Albula goreensis]|uniref:MIF4G domain-containing protein n=1 Tax=Albula goreensis TaxID=1534307 RepID=A0A8T3DH14_9TELE|nr:hypothetical protein AGOR_G00098430 [Albula goreensis]
MDKSAYEEYIQSFDLEAQYLLKATLEEPRSVELQKVSSIIVDRSLKDGTFCKKAGRLCYTIAQLEAKQSNSSVFRRHLLNRLQDGFKDRDVTRDHSVQEWVCYVTFICTIFDYLKVNSMPMLALVNPVYDCLFRLGQADALVNNEEVECLVVQLHQIGEQLERLSAQRMDELFDLLRDGFLMHTKISSIARLQLLEILEYRAGGWRHSDTVKKYYYSEVDN